MILVDVLPKDESGKIIFSPAAEMDGSFYDGIIDVDWFRNNFSNLANINVPLSDSDFTNLKAIDRFWSMNADKWRQQGII